jgi:hypothetical protein
VALTVLWLLVFLFNYFSSLSIDRFFLDKVKLEICPPATFTEEAKIAVSRLLETLKKWR